MIIKIIYEFKALCPYFLHSAVSANQASSVVINYIRDVFSNHFNVNNRSIVKLNVQIQGFYSRSDLCSFVILVTDY